MENDNTKPLTQSETAQWLIALALVYVVKVFGLPALPDAVQGEAVTVIGHILDFAFAAGLTLAAKARMKARAIVDRVW